MPYKVAKDGDQYCVQKEDGTAVKGGCHPNKADAESMMKAIYANENKAAQTKERLLDQTEVSYTPVSMQAGKACAGCRWFEPAEGYGDGDDLIPSCHLVYSWPQSIQPTGYCDRYEVVPAPQPMTQTPMPVVIVEPTETDGMTGMAELSAKVEKNVVEKLVKAFRGVIEKTLPEPEISINGFKVFKDDNGQDRWLAFYSNNFEDREKEYFREKGFDRYVQRLDMGLVAMPELWSWHTKGTRYGIADWVDRIGHFHIATGTYDDTPAGQAGKEYDAKHWKDYGVSHGFVYRKSDVEVIDDKRVYKDWNTFEVSPLPSHRAANEFTAFAVEQNEGIKEIEMDAEKRKHLAEKFAKLGGEEYVAKLETLTEQRGKEMEELKGYKDFVHPDGDSEAAANKEAVENADKAFGELMPELMADVNEGLTASVQAVKAVKIVQAENVELHKLVDTLRSEVKAIRDGAPRASASAKTLIDEKDELNKKSQVGNGELAEVLPGLYKS